MQVAFAYLEHIAANGADAPVVVQSAQPEENGADEANGGGMITVCAAGEATNQMLAYRERAKSMVQQLISRLSRERPVLSQAEKETICVQYQMLDDFNVSLQRIGGGNVAP